MINQYSFDFLVIIPHANDHGVVFMGMDTTASFKKKEISTFGASVLPTFEYVGESSIVSI